MAEEGKRAFQWDTRSEQGAELASGSGDKGGRAGAEALPDQAGELQGWGVAGGQAGRQDPEPRGGP